MGSNMQLVNFALGMLKWIGHHPYQNKLFLIGALLMNIIRLFYIYLIMLRAVIGFPDFTIFVTSLESFSTYFQGLTKIIPLVFYRNELSRLMRGIDAFWELDNNGMDYATILKAFIAYKYFGFLTLFVLIGNALLKSEFMFECYTPNSEVIFMWMRWVQYCQLFYDAVLVISVDLMFVSICLIIREQFRILIVKLNEMDNLRDNCVKEVQMRSWIKHHSFMFQYAALLDRTYSLSLLLQYMISTYTFCVELFLLTEKKEFAVAFRSLCYMIIIMFQISLICLPAQEVTTMALEVSHAAYDMNWYNLPNRLQENVRMIIRLSQQPIILKAAKMILINRETLTWIFQGSLSFYTLIQQFKEN